MGNQLIKGFDIDKEPLGNGGVNSHWKIYQGYKQDKSKQPVSIFIFEKKAIEKLPKALKEEFLVTIRKEAQGLARFKHPNILSILEPLMEDPKSIAFITERIESCLITMINNNKVQDICPTELDTKFHFIEIIDALSFIHDDVKIAHLSISPENIYITTGGKWKIAGFLFSTQIVSDTGVNCPSIEFPSRMQAGYEFKLAPMMHFAAPELTESPAKAYISSDIFSLGCLMYTIFKISSDGNCNNPYLISSSSHNGYKESIKNLDKQTYSFVPQQLRTYLFKMITTNTNRLKIKEVLNSAWFIDPFVQTVKMLETLYQKDFTQQQQFLKGLSRILLRFEPKFLKLKIIPIMCNLLKNDQLSSSILPSFFNIMEKKDFFSRSELNEQIIPAIKALATGKEMPAQSLYLIIMNLNTLLEYTEKEDLNNIFLPLMIKSYECGVQKLQDLALKNTEMLMKKLDYSMSKTKVLPRLLQLCQDAKMEVRKSALLCLNKTYGVFDPSTQGGQILDALEKVKKLPTDRKINMILLGVFKGISGSIGIDTLANKILLSMIPMLVDPSISKTEFKGYLDTIQTMIKRIETEQLKNFEGIPEQAYQDDEIEPETAKPESQNPVQEDKSGNEFDFLSMFDNSIANINTNQNTNNQNTNEIWKNNAVSNKNQNSNDIQINFDDFLIGPGESSSSATNLAQTQQNPQARSSLPNKIPVQGLNLNQNNQSNEFNFTKTPQGTTNNFDKNKLQLSKSTEFKDILQMDKPKSNIDTSPTFPSNIVANPTFNKPQTKSDNLFNNMTFKKSPNTNPFNNLNNKPGSQILPSTSNTNNTNNNRNNINFDEFMFGNDPKPFPQFSQQQVNPISQPMNYNTNNQYQLPQNPIFPSNNNNNNYGMNNNNITPNPYFNQSNQGFTGGATGDGWDIDLNFTPITVNQQQQKPFPSSLPYGQNRQMGSNEDKEMEDFFNSMKNQKNNNQGFGFQSNDIDILYYNMN